MPSERDVLLALQQQITGAVTGLTAADGTVMLPIIGTNFPSARVVENVARKNTQPVISIFDRSDRQSTRWTPMELSQTATAASVTAALVNWQTMQAEGTALLQAEGGQTLLSDGGASAPGLPPYGTATITVTGPIIPGDAIALTAINYAGGSSGAQAYGQVAAYGDFITPAVLAQAGVSQAMAAEGGLTLLADGSGQSLLSDGGTSSPPRNTVSSAGFLAAALAANISADPVLSTWLNATATGATITLTSLLPSAIAVRVTSGNGGVQVRELGRVDRDIMVTTWTRTVDDRWTLAAALEALFGTLMIDTGLPLPNSEPARLILSHSHNNDGASTADIYRRDFMLSVDHAITTQDALYALLVAGQVISPNL